MYTFGTTGTLTVSQRTIWFPGNTRQHGLGTLNRVLAHSVVLVGYATTKAIVRSDNRFGRKISSNVGYYACCLHSKCVLNPILHQGDKEWKAAVSNSNNLVYLAADCLRFF